MSQQPTVQEVLTLPSLIAELGHMWGLGLDTYDISERFRRRGHLNVTEAFVFNNIKLIRDAARCLQ